MNIRHALPEDLNQLARIEEVSYPTAEGASKDSIRKRIHTFPDYFWILESNHKILGFINGLVTNQSDLTDKMYDHPEIHDDKGAWQMIFSVVTAPEYREHGYAARIMEQVIADCRFQNRSGIVLTCKEHLLHYYAKFGFVNEGISQSTHGDVMWYQMRLTF